MPNLNLGLDLFRLPSIFSAAPKRVKAPLRRSGHSPTLLQATATTYKPLLMLTAYLCCCIIWHRPIHWCPSMQSGPLETSPEMVRYFYYKQSNDYIHIRLWISCMIPILGLPFVVLWFGILWPLSHIMSLIKQRMQCRHVYARSFAVIWSNGDADWAIEHPRLLSSTYMMYVRHTIMGSSNESSFSI